MFEIIIFLFRILIKSTLKSDENQLIRIAVLEKEIAILKRRLRVNNYKVSFHRSDKVVFAIASKLSAAKNLFSIVKTDTVLGWYKTLIKKRWTFKNKKKPNGRPSISLEIKELVISMKNSNIMWGCRRISNELEKVGIVISHESVRKIIAVYRKRGKINKSLTWSSFITSHIKSLYSMDCFTVDSLLGKHYFILVILEVKTRKIIQFAITENPTREFVRQQIIEFTNSIPGIKYLIHDRAPEFCSIDYSQYDIIPKKTSVKSPNMNAYVERAIGTIQREALDWFIIFNRKQLYNILKEYTHYYNNYRPHQGVNKIPVDTKSNSKGSISKKPILSGLHNHYFRAA